MKKIAMLLLCLAALCIFSLPRAVYGQYLNFSFHGNAKNGAKVYKAACASCHGNDGKGAPQTLSEFERPSTFPDFTDCKATTKETNASYKDTILNGGPNRGFSEIMPSFKEALTPQEVDDVIAYLRAFCRNPDWPAGELNLPRALVTEKAYPEDEVVISTAVNAQGAPANETHVIHEQRFGVKNQIEIDVPIIFQDQNHTWYGGVGDATVGFKRAMYSSLKSGSIFSLFGGFLIPSGNRSRGFGSGTTSFETFAAYDQLFRTDTFVQLQFGAELPFRTEVAPNTIFFNSVIGQSFAPKNGLGRLWSPMFEFTASRDLVDNAKTDWDVIPEMQVTISRRQHIRGNLGFLIPVTNTTGRPRQVLFYLLWDWADGSLLEGW